MVQWMKAPMTAMAPAACILGAAMLLSGCASLSEAECVSGDWYTIGYEDGAEGHPPGRIGEHRQACADYGVRPDLEEYTQGHERGMRFFCQPRNGFEAGSEGKDYKGGCPFDLEGLFLAAYEDGLQLHYLKEEVERVEARIYDLERDLRDIDDKIRKKQDQLDESYDADPRNDNWGVRADIQDLRYERDRIRDELSMVRQDLYDARSRVSTYRPAVFY